MAASLVALSEYWWQWGNLLFRWLHVIAAIAWVGASFYFIALDNHLERPKDPRDIERGVGGEAWEIHGGGFYRVEKFTLAPAELPEPLYWFKWEAYTTWLSGFALFIVVYYAHATSYLHGHSVGDAVLCEASRRLRAACEGTFLARIGGDEFIAVAELDSADLTSLIGRLEHVLDDDLAIGDHAFSLGLSIGIAMHPRDGRDAIMRMGRVLQRLEALDRELQSRPPHSIVGPGSLHASIVTGGRELSSYPDHCRLQMERRTVGGESGEAALRHTPPVSRGTPAPVSVNPLAPGLATGRALFHFDGTAPTSVCHPGSAAGRDRDP